MLLSDHSGALEIATVKIVDGQSTYMTRSFVFAPIQPPVGNRVIYNGISVKCLLLSGG